MPDDPYLIPDHDGRPSKRRGNLDELINRHSARTGLDPEFVKRVVIQESGGKPRARSWAGASGLGQLMPGTAKRYGVRDVNDPDENLRGATDYLRDLSDEFKDPEKVLAAYNAGEGAVRKHGYERVRQFSNFPRGDPRRGGYAGSTGAYVDKILKGYGQQPQQPADPYLAPDPYLIPDVGRGAFGGQGLPSTTTPPPVPAVTLGTQEAGANQPGRFAAMARATPMQPIRRSQPRARGQVEAAGLGAPPITIADLKRAEEQPAPDSRQQFAAQVQNEKAARGQLRQQVAEEWSSPLWVAQAAIDPRQAIRRLQGIDTEVSKRYADQLRQQQPEVTEGRQELGRMGAGQRWFVGPSLRLMSGVLKSASNSNPALVGLEKLTGKSLTDYFAKKGQVLEDVANTAPLTAAGEEAERGTVRVPGTSLNFPAEKAATAGVDLTFTLVTLAALQRSTGMPLSNILAIEAAAKTKDPLEVGHAYAMGKVLDTHLSRTGSAALFGAPTAAQGAVDVAGGGPVEDALLNTAIQAGTGWVFGKPKRGVRGETTPTRTTRAEAAEGATAQSSDRPVLVDEVAPRQPLGARGETVTAGIPERPTPVAEEVKSQPRWQHRDFGQVIQSENQAGVGRGRVRVTAEDGTEHVIQRANLRGEGNNIAIPIREQGDLPETPAVSPQKPAAIPPTAEGVTPREAPSTSREPARTETIVSYERDTGHKDGDGRTITEIAPQQVGQLVQMPEHITRVGVRVGRVTRVDANGKPLDVTDQTGTFYYLKDGKTFDADVFADDPRRQVKPQPKPSESVSAPKVVAPISSKPATESQVQAAQSPNGSETHLTVRRFLASEYKDRILKEIGSDAVALNPTELGGIKASSVSFRKADGSVVTVTDAMFADQKPTYGDKRDGFAVTRSEPAPQQRLAAASQAEVAPPQPSNRPIPRGETAVKSRAMKQPWEMSKRELHEGWNRGELLIDKHGEMLRVGDEVILGTMYGPTKARITGFKLRKGNEPLVQVEPIQVGPKQTAPGVGFKPITEWELSGTSRRRYGELTEQQRTLADATSDRADIHRMMVEQAIREGKPVPPEVLADYPDLAARVPPTTAAPKTTEEPPTPKAKAAASPPTTQPTTITYDNKTYTRNERGVWIRDDGKRVAGITEQRLNELAQGKQPSAQKVESVQLVEPQVAQKVVTPAPVEEAVKPLDIKKQFKRAQVIDALSRDEFPYKGWEKDYPDLAGQRRQQVAPLPPSIASARREPARPTVVRNESLRADRAELGLPELERQRGAKAQEVFNDALKANATDPRAPDVLVEQALRGGKNWTDKETLQVGLRTQEVKNHIQQVKADLVKATDGETIRNKSAELDALVDDFARIHEAGELAGAEWSAAGRARQVQISEDYTYEGLVARAKSALKRDLTPEQKEQYRKQADRIVELETQLAQATERAANNRIQSEIHRIHRQTKRSETKAMLDAEFAALKQQLTSAKLEVKESGVEYRQGGIGLASLDPSGKLTPIIARMARNRAKAGVTSAEKLIDEVYYAVKAKYDVARDDVADIIRNTLHEPGDVLTRWDAARQKRLVEQIMETRTRGVERDFTARKREPPIYNRETARLQRQIDETKVAFNREMYRATRSMGGKISDELAKAANVPKTIKSIGDISAVFRQGGFYAITHPVKGLALPFRDMVRSFSDAGFRNVESAIKSHPKFEASVKDGVEYTGVNKDDPRLSRREEGFISSEYLDYVPVVKQIKDFSERTFVSFLDSQRLNMYDTLTDGLANPTRLSRIMGAKGGLSRADLAADRQRIVRAINSATGRGNLTPTGNQIAPVLNIAMFSPRLLKSRVELLNNMFNPVAWARMPRNARAQILQDNVKFIGATIGVLTLAKSLGAEVNYDPDDSDFLKIRAGNTTYDTLTGLQQPLRFLLNMGAAVKADVIGSETYAGRPKAELAGRFARSKLSPSAGTALNYITGEDFMGRKFDIKREARELVTPLPASDVIEAFKKDGIIGAVKATPTLVGIGVGTYPPPPEKPATHAEKLVRKMIRDSMPEVARDEEEIERSRKLTDLRARSRHGEDVTAELAALNPTPRQRTSIEDAKSRTRFEEDFNRMGIENALRVWSVATSEEKALVKPLLAKKADNVDSLEPSKQAAIKVQLRAIGIVPIEELSRERQQELSKTRRGESREQARERYEKQRAQRRSGQRPSAGYGYQ